MATPAFTRADVERAEPLDFEEKRSERQCNITVELAPDGVHIRAEYVGPLSTIPAVIERLRALGVVELVQASRPVLTPGLNSTNGGKPRAETVTPIYQPDGTPCCPTHKQPLVEGRYGLYCPSRAKPGDAQNAKGYCALRFAD